MSHRKLDLGAFIKLGGKNKTCVSSNLCATIMAPLTISCFKLNRVLKYDCVFLLMPHGGTFLFDTVQNGKD